MLNNEELRDQQNMQLKKCSEKSRAVLKAIGKGCSCEQILAGDRTLTYHDIFHAVSEAPTSIWKKEKTPQAKR
jgi:hypothetical protein